MNTEFYKQIISILREEGISGREFARRSGLSYGTTNDLLSPKRKFKPLRPATMGKIHKAFNIPYELMEEYNAEIEKERGN